MNTLWIFFLHALRRWATRRLQRAAVKEFVRRLERRLRAGAAQAKWN
jgi:hypothetical protein